MDYAHLNPSPVPMHPRAPESVEVFSAARPERPYVEVVVIEAQQSTGWSADRTPELIGKMRESAASIGCDGIILTGNDAVVGSPSSRWGSVGTVKGYRGTCIMYKPVAAKPAVPAAAEPQPPTAAPPATATPATTEAAAKAP